MKEELTRMLVGNSLKSESRRRKDIGKRGIVSVRMKRGDLEKVPLGGREYLIKRTPCLKHDVKNAP